MMGDNSITHNAVVIYCSSTMCKGLLYNLIVRFVVHSFNVELHPMNNELAAT